MRAIVVGAGHNGLVGACYLARAGVEVTVLEASDAPGGGSRTDELLPGHRFDTHSVAHNIINMTPIPRELDLAGAGLVYREMDPFAVAVFADGRMVRFHRSVERTVTSIAEHDPAEAQAYADFMASAVPLVDLWVSGLVHSGAPRALAGRVVRRTAGALAAVRRDGALRLAGELLAPYGTLLRSRLPSDLTRGPVAAFAAHAGAAPNTPGSAAFGFWQAVYHRFGQWHAVGGSGALTAALVRRLESLGGTVRCNAVVERIDTAASSTGGGTEARPSRRGGAVASTSGRVRGVVVAGGERLEADGVVAAIDPRCALLELLDPPLGGADGAALRATHRSNTVQALVHVATTALPAYPGARPGDHNGLQSYVDSLDDLQDGFAQAEARRLPSPAPAYAFTTSALDDTLAPPGAHTVYLACPAAPFAIEGGWVAAGERLAEDLLAQVEARAPGFRDTVTGIRVRTPADMARELRWPGAHPMHLDVTPDQLGPLRPIPALASHRTPVGGLYVGGAGTAPTGGIAGAPGRGAARALLRDARRT